MKKFIICLIAAAMCSCFMKCVSAQDDTKVIIEQELGAFDFSSWDYSDEDFNFNARNMIENYLDGAEKMNTVGIIDFFVLKIKNIILSKVPLIMLLLAGGIVSGLCNSLIPDEKSDLRGTVSFVTSAMCVAVITGTVLHMIKTTVQAVNQVSAFTEAAMPVMSIIMIASGRKATEAVFSPVMAFISGTAALIIKNVVVPVIIAGFVFAIVGALGGKTQTGKLFGLAKSSTKWICGIITTLFTGVVTIYGLGAKSHDTLTMKTTKYVIDKSVPIVGSFISGTADTILECFTAIKTASGAVFMTVLSVMAAKPLFDIFGTIISLRIAAAICEPIADPMIPKLMSDTADIANFLFAAAAMLNVMLIIAVGICTCILG